jgi:hypothetical protein
MGYPLLEKRMGAVMARVQTRGVSRVVIVPQGAGALLAPAAPVV